MTSLLADARRGDERARAALLEAVYDELRGLARRHLRAEASSHTLQPTALVHEAYMRLGCPREEDWETPAHFVASCAVAMRRILIEHARRHDRGKRGGVAAFIDLFVPKNTRQSEIIATAYSAWKNLLLDGFDPAIDEIIYESRQNWHEAKMDITAEEFRVQLNWMRRNKVVPSATGRRVLRRAESA